LHAFRRADLQSGQSVLVFGVGAIGLLACSLAKSYGASKVAAIDINPQRLKFAHANGFADDFHCLPVTEKAKTTDEQLRRAKESASSALSQLGEHDGFDVIFECTGAEPCIQMSIHVRSISASYVDLADLLRILGGDYRRESYARWNGI
jgi:L-iditol 2-dehydrogenase